MGRFESLRLLIKYNNLGAEFFKSISKIFSQAHEKVLIAFITFAFDKHSASVEILAKVLPHIPYDGLVEDITTDSGFSPKS